MKFLAVLLLSFLLLSHETELSFGIRNMIGSRRRAAKFHKKSINPEFSSYLVSYIIFVVKPGFGYQARDEGFFHVIDPDFFTQSLIPKAFLLHK